MARNNPTNEVPAEPELLRGRTKSHWVHLIPDGDEWTVWARAEETAGMTRRGTLSHTGDAYVLRTHSKTTTFGPDWRELVRAMLA